MSNNLCFFAVHADDLPRARRFYESVFGWKFQPWGPPGFFLIATGDQDDPGIQGALQQRHEVVPGERINGYECTISVADIDAAAAAVTANGGKIVLPKCEIPTVGWLIKVQDPEGNIVCVKQPANDHADFGIYQIEDDLLTICRAAPGKDRPTEFASKPGSGQTLMTYKRGAISERRR